MNFGQPLPVLMYHHVSPVPGLVTCSPENFREQMRWLAESGWNTLSNTQFEDAIETGNFPEKSVLITFDDGYLDNWVYAYPILKEFGLRATLFVVTGWLGDGDIRPVFGQADIPEILSHGKSKVAVREGRFDEAFLRWSEVNRMREEGVFDFHSHTHSHVRWDKKEIDASKRVDLLATDLEQSQATLMTRLGIRSKHLCWPQGYFEAAYQRVACEAGFSYLYTTEHGVTGKETDPLRIPRVVAKDKARDYFSRRMNIYGSKWLSRPYLFLKQS